jgi:hypothetical protein
MTKTARADVENSENLYKYRSGIVLNNNKFNQYLSALPRVGFDIRKGRKSINLEDSWNCSDHSISFHIST